MTRDEILKKLQAGKITLEEASGLLAENTPTVRIVSCPFENSKDFLNEAKPLEIVGNDLTVTLKPKEFSTGSYGWSYSGKLAPKAGGKFTRVQASINLVVIGSKP